MYGHAGRAYGHLGEGIQPGKAQYLGELGGLRYDVPGCMSIGIDLEQVYGLGYQRCAGILRRRNSVFPFKLFTIKLTRGDMFQLLKLISPVATAYTSCAGVAQKKL